MHYHLYDTNIEWISRMTCMLVCHCLSTEKILQQSFLGKIHFPKSQIFYSKIKHVFFFGQTSNPKYNTTVYHVWKQSLKDFFGKSLWQSFYNFWQKWHFEDILENFELKTVPIYNPFCLKVCLECKLWCKHTDYGLKSNTYYGL